MDGSGGVGGGTPVAAPVQGGGDQGGQREGQAIDAKKVAAPEDEFVAALKKRGGIKYKAHGKERTVNDVETLTRKLSRADMFETVEAELAKEKAETRAFKERIEKAKTLPPKERYRALGELLGDGKLLDDAATQYFLGEAEREEQSSKLSPAEREWREKHDAAQSELKKYKQQQEEATQRQAQEQEQAQIQQLSSHLSSKLRAILPKVGVNLEAAPTLIPQLASWLQRAESLKLELTDDVVAEKLVSIQDGNAAHWLGAKEPVALLKFLGDNSALKSVPPEALYGFLREQGLLDQVVALKKKEILAKRSGVAAGQNNGGTPAAREEEPTKQAQPQRNLRRLGW